MQDTLTWLFQMKLAVRLYQDICKHKMEIVKHLVKSEFI